MADVTKVNPSMDMITAQYAPQITGLYAGEALGLGDACYLKTSDGKVYKCDGTAANEAAELLGFTGRAVSINEPVTLFGVGTRFRYGASLTLGNRLYLSDATAGGLETSATTGDPIGSAVIVSATDIVVTRGLAAATPAAVAAVKIFFVDGGAAGNHTVTGIAVGDSLISVFHVSTKANVATIADLTSEFTVSAADTINNAAGTDTTNDLLIVFYHDLT